MFAIWGHEKAAEITYYGLHALQHRGQDGAGMVIKNGKKLKEHKDLGLVNDVFERADFSKLTSHAAIGHVLNATEEAYPLDHVQPLVFHSQTGSMALAHHGNIINAYELRGDLENEGSILQTTTDTELLAHLVKRNGKKPSQQSISEALQCLTGAYSYFILTEDCLYVALDPRGLRPLSLGKLGEAYVVASETCAFDIVGATFIREISPGELLTINDDGLQSMLFTTPKQRTTCAMEYIYFSRPDSDLSRINIHASRKNMGKELAKESPIDADVVTGIPDSSISAAIGYAEQAQLPYEMGVIKNRYIGRTFIKPSQDLREQGVKIKLSPVRGIVRGKRVVVIDDSLIRGTTCRRIVHLLREAGATEVHVRIASPKVENPCLYGIDMSTKEELMAANYSTREMQEILEADSVAFLSEKGLEKAIVREDSINQGLCMGCFTGKYPVLKQEKKTDINRRVEPKVKH